MRKKYLWLVKSAFRSLRHPQLRHRGWWKAITRPISNRALWIPCRDTVATGLAIGLFFSMMLMPFQMVPAALLAMRVKANVPFAIAGCWVTNPLTIPPVIWSQYLLGDWLRHSCGVPMPKFLTQVPFPHEKLGDLNAASYMLGMITSAVILALAAYPIVHVFSAILPHHLPVRKKRTVAKAESGL
jgi:uncharacterized protein (DUF2062 family)